MSRHHLVAALVLVVTLATLGACTSTTTAAPQAPLASASASADAGASAAPDEGTVAVAQTCAMVSIITTNLYNAVLDRDAGDLTDQQYAAIVNASALDYKAITVIPPRAGRLLPQVTAVVTAIEDETPASDGAAFQPYLSEDGSGTGYVGSSEALREACEERGYPISTYAGANGGG